MSAPRTGRLLAAGWSLVALATAGAERVTAGAPAPVRMVAVVAVALLALKALVLAVGRAEGRPRPTAPDALAFALGWPGMDPRPFVDRPRQADRGGAARLLRMGLVRLALGAGAIAGGRWLWYRTGSTSLAAPALLVGLSLTLHFGLLNLLAAAWRRVGVPVARPFRAPLASTSLRELWGRRWNRPFTEMSAALIYGPLRKRLGRGPAVLVAFTASGLLHELALSVPVGAGHGGPLAYFALHGALVVTEDALARRGRPLGGPSGRAWTMLWLLGPLPLLFHAPFLHGVVWPLLGLAPGGP